MKNFHKGCEHYVPENDMCLLYFQLGFFEVGKNYPDECVDHFAFAKDEDEYVRVNEEARKNE